MKEKPLKLGTRHKLIRTAVELITARGVRQTSLGDIGKAAGIGPDLLYRHFPNETSLLHAYYADRLKDVDNQLRAVAGGEGFTLQERLQLLHESLLEALCGDRYFVRKTFNTVFVSLPFLAEPVEDARAILLRLVGGCFQEAITAGDIPAPVFERWLQRLMADYTVAVVNYWLRDSSDHFTDTSILLDKSLALICACLAAGVTNKAVDLGSFLFKKHLYPYIGFPLKFVRGAGFLKGRLPGDGDG